MTREEVYNKCLNYINKNPCLLIEAATGFGKSKLAIDMVNHLILNLLTKSHTFKVVKVLLLVAKRVHKQTWEDEIKKWGGIANARITMECYESLKKHVGESFDIILMDEVHHIGSETRLEMLSSISYQYMIGLSATIPRNLKKEFKTYYNAWVVSCDITEAIEDKVLPEPEILLFPLLLDNKVPTETLEINPKAKGPVVKAEYKDYWKYKKSKTHAIISCTQRQYLNEMNALIAWEKNKFMRTRNKTMEFKWLNSCGRRLEYLANCKNDLILSLLAHLKEQRTITFCKTIEQAEVLGSNCIHSQNKDAEKLYDDFNKKKLNHITAVNILNENANLVDCKYAVFANLSSSEVVIPQRLGRAMRHKHPVIIVPYYIATREQEIVEKMFAGYNKDFIKTISSIEEV